MFILLKQIIFYLISGTKLFIKIIGGHKISYPFCKKCNDCFLSELYENSFLLKFRRKIIMWDHETKKFYFEEMNHSQKKNFIIFFLIYFPIAFILGIIKKNIMHICIFGTFIGDLQIFGFKYTVKQKKGHLVFKKFLVVVILIQILAFLKISFYFKILIFTLTVYGNGKEYFKQLKLFPRQEKNSFKEYIWGWFIYGLTSLLDFFMDDSKLARWQENLIKESHKGYPRGKYLYNIEYILELYFYKTELKITGTRLKFKFKRLFKIR